MFGGRESQSRESHSKAHVRDGEEDSSEKRRGSFFRGGHHVVVVVRVAEERGWFGEVGSVDGEEGDAVVGQEDDEVDHGVGVAVHGFDAGGLGGSVGGGLLELFFFLEDLALEFARQSLLLCLFLVPC